MWVIFYIFEYFSAFLGRWFELFKVPFRRLQRFYATGDYGGDRNLHLWVKNDIFCALVIKIGVDTAENELSKVFQEENIDASPVFHQIFERLPFVRKKSRRRWS